MICWYVFAIVSPRCRQRDSSDTRPTGPRQRRTPAIPSCRTARAVARAGSVATAPDDLAPAQERRMPSRDRGAVAAHAATAPRGSLALRGRRLRLTIPLEHVV